jgi:hypothetical protein
MLRDWGAKPIWIGPTLGVMRDLVVPVCRTCNAWMNKRFETPTMPLLRSLVEGTERFITPKAATTTHPMVHQDNHDV